MQYFESFQKKNVLEFPVRSCPMSITSQEQVPQVTKIEALKKR